MWFIFANRVSFCLKWFIYLFFGWSDCPPSLLLPQIVHLCYSRQGITMGTCKTSHSGRFRHIEVCSGIVKHILTSSGIINHIQALVSYIQIFRTLCNCVLYEMNTMIFLIPPWTQDVNWTYIKRSEDIQFTSCVQGTGLN